MPEQRCQRSGTTGGQHGDRVWLREVSDIHPFLPDIRVGHWVAFWPDFSRQCPIVFGGSRGGLLCWEVSFGAQKAVYRTGHRKNISLSNWQGVWEVPPKAMSDGTPK
jgi:hypothetical protein